MATKSKIRTTIELNPGDKERLQNIALLLGFVQTRGTDTGVMGSISQLMQAIAAGKIIVIDKAMKEANNDNGVKNE